MQVSVIIPFFNASDHIDLAISSALIQPEVSELILVDDGSTDQSLEICQQWASKDQRIVICHADGNKNKGPGAARNRGIRASTKPFIAFLDADDHYLKERFRDDKVLFYNFGEAVGVYNSILIETWNQQEIPFLNNVFRHHLVLKLDMPYQKIRTQEIFQSNGVHLNGLTIRREILPRVGLFDERLRQGQDLDFLFRLIQTGVVYAADQSRPKAVYYIHKGNTVFQLPKTLFYRKKLYRKLLLLSLQSRKIIGLSPAFFRFFLEYYYLEKYQNKQRWRRWMKITLLPSAIFQLIFGKNTTWREP